MSSDALAELPLHIALFACGAFGYWATRWAKRRLVCARCPPAKTLARDEEEALPPSQCSDLCEPECEPSALPTSRKVRRRTSRRAKLAVITASQAHLDPADEADEMEAAAAAPSSTEAPEPPAASERMVRLRAKKAARKERKAQEHRQLAEQLTRAPAPSEPEVAVPTEGHDSAEADEASTDDAPGEVQVVDYASSVSDSIEPLAQDMISQDGLQLELCAADEDDFGGPEAGPAEEDEFGWLEDAFTDDEDALGWRTSGTTAVGNEAASGPAPVGVLPALDGVGSGPLYTPILSVDGQQLYTDGCDVYMMMAACDQVLHAVTDPGSPLHDVARDMGVTGARQLVPPTLASSPLPAATAVAAPRLADLEAKYYDSARARSLPARPNDEDKLWDICWEFIV